MTQSRSPIHLVIIPAITLLTSPKPDLGLPQVLSLLAKPHVRVVDDVAFLGSTASNCAMSHSKPTFDTTGIGVIAVHESCTKLFTSNRTSLSPTSTHCTSAGITSSIEHSVPYCQCTWRHGALHTRSNCLHTLVSTVVSNKPIWASMISPAGGKDATCNRRRVCTLLHP